MSPPNGIRDKRKSGKPLFALGQVVATPSVLESVPPDEVLGFLRRHVKGDWGEVNSDDARENELALKNQFRIFSVYHSRRNEKVWVITEADRSSTAIMFPEDY